MPWKGKDLPDHLMTIQVAPDDCTGCGVCVDVCPAKSKEVVKHKAINMEPKLRASRTASGPTSTSSWSCPNLIAAGEDRHGQRFAAAGAAVRVLGSVRRLRRDALCEADESDVWRPGADRQRHGLFVDLRRQSADDSLDAPMPTGRGPTWSNSLFEDNAEFGLGLRLAVDQKREYAEYLLRELAADVGDDLVDGTA